MKTFGSDSRAPPFLTSAPDGSELSTLHPGRFTPRETAPGTHCTGGWVGSRDSLDAVEKIKILPPPPPPRNRNLVAQPVARYYTDRAIPALYNLYVYNPKHINIYPQVI
jgi:hypothetical protein